MSSASFEVDTMDLIDQFNRCLEKESLRYCCAHRDDEQFRRRLCLKESIYICYLVDWKVKFKDNLFLVNLDEYKADQMGTLKQLYEWLGVRTDIDFSGLEKTFSEAKNVGKVGANEVMREKSRKRLNVFFQPYNNMLAEYFKNDNFKSWNIMPSHYDEE